MTVQSKIEKADETEKPLTTFVIFKKAGLGIAP